MSTRTEALRLRLEGWTYRRIGQELHVSRQRIQQITSPPTAIRRHIIQQANGRCEGCGIEVRHGHIHHKSIDTITPDTYNEIDNLQLLCIGCHRGAHGLGGPMKQIDGLKLREWRKAQHRSLESLAHDIGISYITLHKWETNQRKTGILPISFQALQKIGYQE